MWQELCDRTEIQFKALMPWISPLPGFFLLGTAGVLHTTPASPRLSHLTLSDRILCATFKSLPGLEPLEAHPSWRLAVTALLVPTGTAWECCKGMEMGCNWSEARACSCDLHAGGQRKRAALSIPTPWCLLLPTFLLSPLLGHERQLLVVGTHWNVMDTSAPDRIFPHGRKPLVGKVKF